MNPTSAEENEIIGVKLFVGQVPRNMEETDLHKVVEKFGQIESIVIIRDKLSFTHRGCAFVTFVERKDAEAAIAALHNQVTLPPATNPLQVREAEGQGAAVQEHKLFIGMIPKSADESDIREMFKVYGEIEEVYILRNPNTGHSKGCAFLKYKLRESAMTAISEVHGQLLMEGGSTTLVVKLADSRRQRMNRARTQGQGAMPQYWGMPGPGMPFPQLQHMQHQYMQQMQQFGMNPQEMQHAMPAPNAYYNPFPMGQYGYPNSGYGYPPNSGGVSEDGGVENTNVASTGNAPPTSGHSTISSGQLSEGSGPRSSGQLEGPSGANLFIYHLPHDLTDADLATAFAPFGTVISAKVYMDKVTGESKGFGFVSYDAKDAADAAIASMNGFQIGTKRLKVQHKRVHGREDFMDDSASNCSGQSGHFDEQMASDNDDTEVNIHDSSALGSAFDDLRL